MANYNYQPPGEEPLTVRFQTDTSSYRTALELALRRMAEFEASGLLEKVREISLFVERRGLLRTEWVPISGASDGQP